MYLMHSTMYYITRLRHCKFSF